MAHHDLAVWLRSPAAIAAALLPALGMGVLVAMLTVSVGRQPVALVVEGQGKHAARMARIIKGDEDAYLLGWMLPPVAWTHALALVALLAAVTLTTVGLGTLLGVGLRDLRLVTMTALNASAYLFFLGGGFTTVAFLPLAAGREPLRATATPSRDCGRRCSTPICEVSATTSWS